MSADNWTTCPRCALRHKKRGDKLRDDLAAAYGVVPVGEYLAKMAEAEAASGPFTEMTFREDYEFYGAETGSVTASYRGGCTVCGLAASIEHTFPIEGIDA